MALISQTESTEREVEILNQCTRHLSYVAAIARASCVAVEGRP
jgi:hypothetical protein